MLWKLRSSDPDIPGLGDLPSELPSEDELMKEEDVKSEIL